VTIYKYGDTWNAGDFPAILAIGDSWFWYPKNNVLTALTTHPKMRDEYRSVEVLGQNGATISQYVEGGDYAGQFQHELRPENLKYYSGVMISGGGNDSLNYGLGLNLDCTGITKAEDCISATGLDTLLRSISGALGHLIHDVAWAFKGQNRPPEIFVHGYDYPVPDGRPFSLAGLKVTGPWFKPALDTALVADDIDLRKQVCHLLVDALHSMLMRFDNPGAGVHYIDNRGVLSTAPADYKNDWDNEFHPTISGFGKIVSQRWIPVMQKVNFAKF
jgi:hypothetical protein